ncbi:uncharacterized protein BT62DRAFT_1009470 [Guyanagaster necrorhizus]|uniref:Uncharacterized protein n=1 Tax=Guyanagaster necrorhizus TaxID=856835 RepID=A0A9P7VLC3_9AGAR|nr:uncharacterized protein BT62DRAFT_1009470 [Guyanagaster necrorhizus MCA 3950]KAG7443266.1 hypothetical protein BT62DRAFT_1009470 [Guyanagaster necrorhizus MCA 3950]
MFVVQDLTDVVSADTTGVRLEAIKELLFVFRRLLMPWRSIRRQLYKDPSRTKLEIQALPPIQHMSVVNYPNAGCIVFYLENAIPGDPRSRCTSGRMEAAPPNGHHLVQCYLNDDMERNLTLTFTERKENTLSHSTLRRIPTTYSRCNSCGVGNICSASPAVSGLSQVLLLFVPLLRQPVVSSLRVLLPLKFADNGISQRGVYCYLKNVNSSSPI